MTTPTRVNLANLLCDWCNGVPLAGTCLCVLDNPEAVAAEVRRRHEISILRAAYRLRGPKGGRR